MARAIRSAFAGFALLIATLRADGAESLLSTAEGQGGFEIIFRQAGAGAGHVEIGDREIVLRFSRPVPEGLEAELQSTVGHGGIEEVAAGYDSVLLRFAQTVAARSEVRGDTLVLIVALGSAPAVPGAAQSEDRAARRLGLVEARALALGGEVGAARERLAAIRKSAPGDPEPVTALAAIEQETGHWRLARDLYREAMELDPHDEENRLALAAIERNETSRLRLDFDYREVKGAERVYTTRLGGHSLVKDGWRVGGSLDTAYVTTRSVLRTSGDQIPFEGVRQRSEAFLQRDFLDGQILRGTAYGGMRSGGIGLDWQRPDDFGSIAAHGEFSRPNWDFVEGLVNGATRDRLSVARQHNFGARLSGRLEAGVQRYAVPGFGGVGDSGAVTGELRYALLSGAHNLGIVYTLDGEYPWHVRQSTGTGGVTFKPIPLAPREVHTLTASYAEDLFHSPASDHSLLVEGFGGWGLDRFGRPGPLVGVTLTLNEGPVQAQLRGSQVRHIGRGGESVTLIGGSLMWLF